MFSGEGKGFHQMLAPTTESPSYRSHERLDLSLIIPCHNEEGRLGSTLDRLRAILDASSLRWEVIVVDDGSTDDTSALALAAERPFRLISLERNTGKGGAIQAGMLAARGNIVAFTDADLPFRFESLFRAIGMIRTEDYDAVFGDRHHPLSRTTARRSWSRRLGSEVFSRLQQLLLPLETRDTQCGLKAFRRSVGIALFRSLEIKGFAFDVEIVAKAEYHQVHIGTVPVDLIRDESSKVSLFRHSLPMLLGVLMTRLRLPHGETMPSLNSPVVMRKSA